MIDAGQTLGFAPWAATREQSPVVPRNIFAAGRQSFEATVFGAKTVNEAAAVLFTFLPLRENGWDRDFTTIKRLGNGPGYMVVSAERRQ